MAKKNKPVDIKITGAQQVVAVQEVYAAKDTADESKLKYDNARKGAMSILLGKVFAYWTKHKKVQTGAYCYHLPDGTTKSANAQNRQSTKTYDPANAKDILASLNLHTEPGAQLNAKDVYNIAIEHSLHPDAISIKAVKEKILTTLTELEAELKKEHLLPPEVSLIQEKKKLVLAEHALDRILALSSNFEEAMVVLDNPITLNLVNSTT